MPVAEKSNPGTQKGKGSVGNSKKFVNVPTSKNNKPGKLKQVQKMNTKSSKNSQSTTASSTDGKLYEMDEPIQKRYSVVTRLGKGVSAKYIFCEIN